MKSALLENPRATTTAPQVQHRGTTLERPLSVDQLARAVGEHALRQAEIDQKMVTRIIELRDELSSAKDEINSLRSQMNQLIRGLSQGLAIAQQQSASTTKSALETSLASLRSR
jgi:DNA-binding ferritin-like protein